MGRLGTTSDGFDGVVPGSPMLQVGGAQEAVRVAPPELLRAVALLAPVVLVVVENRATSGLVVLQVRGGVGMGMPVNLYKVSTAVAVTDTLLPKLTVIEFPAWPWPAIWR